MDKLAIRIDRASTFSSFSKTDEGYLVITAPIAKVGIYKYRSPDGGIISEFVPPTTLSDLNSITSLKLKPVTKLHPKKFVDSKLFKELTVGSVGESVTFEPDNLLYATFVVSDDATISAIESGLNELSPAYYCDFEEVSGTWNGEKYDRIQINRRYNHLAIVDKARGGSELAIKMDDADSINFEDIVTNNNRGVIMPTVRIDGVDFTIDETVGAHIGKLVKKADDLDTALNTEKTNVITLTAKVDSLTEEVENLKSKDNAGEIAKRVDAKIALISKAEKILGVGTVKADDDDLAIMKRVISKVSPNAKLDGFTGNDEFIYVTARFDSAIELTSNGIVTPSRAQFRTRKDGDDQPQKTARELRNDSLNSNWKKDK